MVGVESRCRAKPEIEGDQWWRWSLWIEGMPDDLDRIESVTYILHPTFPEPIRIVTDRASNFSFGVGWDISGSKALSCRSS